MTLSCVHTASQLGIDWDGIAKSTYQRRPFLMHLEQTNPSYQRYYQLHSHGNLKAGAIVYDLKVNLLTFSKRELKIPMKIIGLPLSCSEGGIIGDKSEVEPLLEHILKKEKGIILSVNYDPEISLTGIVPIKSVPTRILNIQQTTWEGYLSSLRHPYRRRINKALEKSVNVTKRAGSCSAFGEEHYQQYLDVVNRSKEKLEILDSSFFKELPEQFILNSFYTDHQLLYWHITFREETTYHFLFGGMNLLLRDTYDSYTNNLIQIVKDGIKLGCKTIELGQTADESKSRFGALAEEKHLFLYHKNPLLRFVFRTFQKQLGHKGPYTHHRVFSNSIPIEVSKKEMVSYA